MQDIRVDDAFFEHPKTVRFFRRTGDHGVACLFRLWCYASKYFPKGILTGMSAKEITDAIHWNGEPSEFINALIDAGGETKKPGFLDVLCDSQSQTQSQTHYALHNWRKRNPYAYFRKERSEVATELAERRWANKRKTKKIQSPNTKGNATGNAPSPDPAPDPAPFPEKKDLAAGVPAGGSEAPAATPKATRLKDACAFIGGCDKRGTIGINGRWYCPQHDPDQDQGILGSIGRPG